MYPPIKLPAEEIAEMLAGCSILSSLDKDAILKLAADSEWLPIGGGETLIRQGEAGDCLYFLISGRLRVVFERPDGGEDLIGDRTRGEIFGEMAVLTGETRAATVRVVRDSDLVRVSTERFNRLIDEHPQIMREIALIAITRLRGATGWKREIVEQLTVAIVPAQGNTAITGFAERLLRALSRSDSVLYLNSRVLDGILGEGMSQIPEDDPKSTDLTSWFSSQEQGYRVVLFEADATDSEWTRRCIRQADQILLVGHADDQPEPGLIDKSELQAITHGAPIRLVLLHPERKASGTRAWLAEHHAISHHHVRPDADEDYQSLARYLTHSAVALVLSGGGARGFAQVGVIRALREVGVPIDLVGGSSVGAVVSSTYAGDWDYETTIRLFKGMFNASLRYLTLPLVSMYSGRHSIRGIREGFGGRDHQIEDSWTPYFCLSCNLSRTETVVHRSGSIAKAIMASAALPGLVPPVYSDGDLLIDGGLLNNLPIDVARDHAGIGRVIAVDVSSVGESSRVPAFDEGLTGWQALLQRFGRQSEGQVPNMISLFVRSAFLSTIYQNKHLPSFGEHDLYLRPPTEDYDLVDFSRVKEIAELGYEYSLEKVESWYRETF